MFRKICSILLFFCLCLNISGCVSKNGNIKLSTKQNTENATSDNIPSVGSYVRLKDDSEWYVFKKDSKNITLISKKKTIDSINFGKDLSSEAQNYEVSLVKEYIDNTFAKEQNSSFMALGVDVSKISYDVPDVESLMSFLDVKWMSEEEKYYSTTTNGLLDKNIAWIKDVAPFWTKSVYPTSEKYPYHFVYFLDIDEDENIFIFIEKSSHFGYQDRTDIGVCPLAIIPINTFEKIF